VGSAGPGGIEIQVNGLGQRTTPSWVSFNGQERLIGDAAKSQHTTNPKNTIYDTKRFIGKTWDDPTLKKDMKHFTYDVVKNDVGKPVISVQVNGTTKLFTPEEIAGMILGNMKGIAEASLGTSIKDAVITVPAYL
jgi:molecular chaperone DnaK (HSP70)